MVQFKHRIKAGVISVKVRGSTVAEISSEDALRKLHITGTCSLDVYDLAQIMGQMGVPVTVHADLPKAQAAEARQHRVRAMAQAIRREKVPSRKAALKRAAARPARTRKAKA